MSTPRRLYRSETNRVLGGVCGGLAEYFGIDPTLVRVLFVVFAVFGGATLILYPILWIVVPPQSRLGLQPPPPPPSPPPTEGPPASGQPGGTEGS